MDGNELREILNDYAKSKQFSGYEEMLEFSKFEKNIIEIIKTALKNAGFSVKTEGIVGEKSIIVDNGEFEIELFEGIGGTK